MAVVVVAGGLGDMGSLIADALVQTGKQEVYIMSRGVGTAITLRFLTNCKLLFIDL